VEKIFWGLLAGRIEAAIKKASTYMHGKWVLGTCFRKNIFLGDWPGCGKEWIMWGRYLSPGLFRIYRMPFDEGRSGKASAMFLSQSLHPKDVVA
jgi:hypothetical protein